jgi:hypothetical protein
MVMENILGQMDLSMKVNGLIIRLMVMESTNKKAKVRGTMGNG